MIGRVCWLNYRHDRYNQYDHDGRRAVNREGRGRQAGKFPFKLATTVGQVEH